MQTIGWQGTNHSSSGTFQLNTLAKQLLIPQKGRRPRRCRQTLWWVYAHIFPLLCQSFSSPWILLQKSMSRMFTLDGREMSSRYQKTNTLTNYSACRLEVILLQTSLIAKVHIDQTSFHLNVPKHQLLLCKFPVSEMWLSRTWLNLDWMKQCTMQHIYKWFCKEITYHWRSYPPGCQWQVSSRLHKPCKTFKVRDWQSNLYVHHLLWGTYSCSYKTVSIWKKEWKNIMIPWWAPYFLIFRLKLLFRLNAPSCKVTLWWIYSAENSKPEGAGMCLFSI
jgi:hypothetical protein